MHKLHNLVFSEYTDLGWEAKTSQVHALFLAKQLLFIMYTGTLHRHTFSTFAWRSHKGSTAASPGGCTTEAWLGGGELLLSRYPLMTTSHFPTTGTPSNSTQTRAEEAWKAHFQWSDRRLCQLRRKDFMLYIHLPRDATSYLLCQELSYIRSFHYRNASILVNWRLQNSTIYEEENFYCLKQLSLWPTHSIFPKRTH